jgi:hypothetical protein
MIKFPKFTERQIDKISDISSEVGLVALVSVVLPAIFDKFDPSLIISGLVATVFFWTFSIWLRR